NILFLEEIFSLDVRERAIFTAALAPLSIIGLVIGARISGRLIERDPGLVLRFLALTSVIIGGLAAVYALSINLAMAFISAALIIIGGAVLGPGILVVLSMAAPPRARSMVFSISSLWILPGLLILPLVGWIADTWGIRYGMITLLPIGLIGGLILSSAGPIIGADIKDVWQTAAARSEVLLARKRGEEKVLMCKGLNTGYGSVQVLFDIDFEVEAGQIVALLGTNGAGKSTLLKAISGIVEADTGAVLLDGRDITHAPPNEIAAHGVTQLPGGAGIFPSLTVAENLRAASWLDRSSASKNWDEHYKKALDNFPMLVERLEDDAGDLSGGQQQILGLAMAFLSRPRLLMIDELSLGLAPVIVEELLPKLQDLAKEGVTIVLVEQSVNVALTVADTAYFMEKGEIKFHGETAELLERPDVLRSVFLEGATAGLDRSSKEAEDLEEVFEQTEKASEGLTAPKAEPVLEVHGISRSFGGITAVSNVSFQVAPKEILGFIGPNGAGKTTLFDLIGGFTESDSGKVALAGRSIDQLTAANRSLRGLGRSFQDARLFPALTVEETLAVALDRWTTSQDPVSAALHLPNAFDSNRKVAARVNELIELMNLGAFRTKFIHELSTGTRRIVDLAMVVAHRPIVVLLDEPSSGIAQKEAEALGPVLESLRSEMGCALVIIEHDISLLRSVVDRMIALDQGAVIAEGDPAVVLRHPTVVSSYLGTDLSVINRSEF
ncbi:MAG: ATP-binding cassette domain-containing protein, partial [Actinomycetota bacterium]|nr:ATP-binding cassette domain-containing protein [Actinomycetota bacterium]